MTDENPYATPGAEVAVPDDGSTEFATRGAVLGFALSTGFPLA